VAGSNTTPTLIRFAATRDIKKSSRYLRSSNEWNVA
jgi:hypothetical protein